MAQPNGFLHTLLTMSLTAVAVLRPLYDATHSVIQDFAWVYLNAAGQRMLQQPERPALSLLTLFPTAQADGVFAKCGQAYETGEPQRYQTNYQADGLDGYFLLAAQRYDNVLVVNFTDTNDQPRTPVEQALRETQAAEQAACAQAEAQRQRFYEVLMALPAQVATYHGPDHVYHFVNAAYRRYFPAQALPGRSLRQVLPETQEQGVAALLDRVYQTGEPSYQQELEVWLDFTGTGQPPQQLFLNLYFHPLRDAQGRVDGILDFSYDVTEQVLGRRRVEQHTQQLEALVQERTRQVQQQSQRLARLVQEAPAAIALLGGPELVLELLNDDYQALFPERTLLGRPMLEAIPELAATPLAEVLQHVYRTGETFEGEEFPVPFAGPDGLVHNRNFDFIYQARYDAAGFIDGIVIFGFDVTERVQRRQQTEALQTELLAAAERRAEERQDLYQIIAQTPVAVVLLREPSHRIDYYNPAFAEVFPPDDWVGDGELRGHTLAEVYPRMRQAGLVQLLDHVFATGESQTVLEMPLAELQPGSPRFITFAYQPYREQGRIVGVAALAYDATEQVLARQQAQHLNEQLAATNAGLHAANTQLTRANADLDTFIYTASHDLRSPVANIEGLIAALRQELLDEPIIKRDVEHILGLMENSIARFQTTIGDLTDIIHLQQDNSKTRRPVDLAALVEAVRLDLAPLLAATQTELLVEVQACPTLHGSPKDLRSIIFNLLSNALKYCDPSRRPRVRLLATCDAHYAELRVQDNGLGLSPEQQTKLFGLFTRLHSHVEGSGVGLYAIKRLVENRGGRVGVESEAGVGSTFWVRLPM